MKHYIVFLSIFLFFLITGCKSDNFYETDRILLTDKTQYCIGDTILLTIKLIPQNDNEKEIRVFEDLRNLIIYPYSKSAIIDNDLYKYDNSGNINTIIISKEKYFERTLHGQINAKDRNQIIIKFNGYDNLIVLDKTKYFNSPDLRLGGICFPIKPEIGASLEEYFVQTKIKIVDCE